MQDFLSRLRAGEDGAAIAKELTKDLNEAIRIHDEEVRSQNSQLLVLAANAINEYVKDTYNHKDELVSADELREIIDATISLPTFIKHLL